MYLLYNRFTELSTKEKGVLYFYNTPKDAPGANRLVFETLIKE